MKVNFFAKVNIDNKNLTQGLEKALDKEGFYLVFKWNKGPTVVMFQITLFDKNNTTIANFLDNEAIKSASGDISVYLENLKGLKKGKIKIGVRAVDDVAKCVAFIVHETPGKNSVITRLLQDENDFAKIDAGKDLEKSDLKFELN